MKAVLLMGLIMSFGVLAKDHDQDLVKKITQSKSKIINKEINTKVNELAIERNRTIKLVSLTNYREPAVVVE